MKVSKWILFSLCFFLYGAGSDILLAQGSLQAILERQQLSLGESVMLELIVESNDVKTPDLPVVADLEVRAAGESSQYSFVNGKVSAKKSYNFQLTPKRTGEFVIPPFGVFVDGKNLMTPELKLSVLSNAPPPGGSGAVAPNQDAQVFVQTSLDHKEVYVHQSVIMYLRIYHRVPVFEHAHEFKAPIEILNFEVEGERTYQEVIGGETYQVKELRRVLKPMQVGIFDLEPVRVRVVMPAARRRNPDPFDLFSGFQNLQRQAQVLEAEPLELTALDLPEGAPADFSGLVGDFTLESDLAPTSLQVGGTSTLTLKLHGEGFIKDLSPLTLPPTPVGIKVYADKPEFGEQLQGSGGIRSSGSFKFALVPTQEGSFNLPEMTMTVFSPTKKSYEVLKVGLGTLVVAGSGAQSPGPPGVTAQGNSPEGAKDQLPSQTQGPGRKDGGAELGQGAQGSDVLRQGPSPLALEAHLGSQKGLLWSLWVAAGIGLFFWTLGYLWRSKPAWVFRLWVALQPGPTQSALRRLKKLQKSTAHPGNLDRQASQELRMILQDYVSDISNRAGLSLNGAAMTLREMGDWVIQRHKLDEDLDLLRRLERLDGIPFGRQDVDTVEWKQTLFAISALLQRI
jgi:hypothetical protein